MERRITIEESVLYKEDYQMRMLARNKIEGLLPVKGRGMNESSCYDYDVSGKISMKAMFERSNINAKDIKTFLLQLKKSIDEVDRYLLNVNCILLSPEYIFYEDGQYYFCYYPVSDKNLWEEFHILTEYFVKHADYEDKECVQITFLIHKETMEENYSLEKIIEKCMKLEVQEEEIKKTERIEYTDEIIPSITYDTSDHDWIAGQHMGSSILKETDNMWSPVRKFLKKHKKNRWGDWEGLYVEEEEI